MSSEASGRTVRRYPFNASILIAGAAFVAASFCRRRCSAQDGHNTRNEVTSRTESVGSSKFTAHCSQTGTLAGS